MLQEKRFEIVIFGDWTGLVCLPFSLLFGHMARTDLLADVFLIRNLFCLLPIG